MSEPQIIAILEKNALASRSTISTASTWSISASSPIFTGTHAEKRPTKKGISLKVAKLPELIEALEKAKAEAERRGLLTAERVS